MRRLMTLLCASLCATAFIVAANPAHADIMYLLTYVSNTGSDANTCNTPATACASFSGALSQTANHGEIDCVDTGSYGSDAFTIQISVTIDCAGAVGFSLGKITVNGDGIVVRLRNLSINRIYEGSFGIDAANMAALYVENCVITNANTAGGTYIGIKFEPSSGPSNLFVTNSIVGNNGSSNSDLSGGIYIVPAMGATAQVSINGSEINGNYFGIVGDGRSGGIIKGTIKHSVVSGNTANGVTALSSGSSVLFVLDQTEVSANAAAGLFAGGSNAGMLVRNTTVVNNGIGLATTGGGGLVSYGNNSVAGNTTNGAFTATVSQQ